MRRAVTAYLAVLILLGALAGVGYFAGALLCVAILVGLPALWVHLLERRQRRAPRIRIFTYPESHAPVAALRREGWGAR